jgi:hypothetical protein
MLKESCAMPNSLAIKEICRDHPIGIVSPSDFQYDVCGTIGLAEVWKNPRYSLYCFDPANQAVLFVESGDPAATDRAAFYYQGQVENAVGLVSMSLDEFHRAGDFVTLPDEKLIFIHSVGRCGSTLISKVLQAVPTVHSLSEPDDLSQLVFFRTGGIFGDEWMRRFIESSVNWRCKPRIGDPAQFVALKPRSEIMVLADLMGELFPAARHFFLYRNAIAWMRTIYRCFTRDIYDEEANLVMESGWAKTLPLVRDLRREGSPMNPIQIRILGWATCMEAYLGLASSDVPSCACRFEDLLADPVGMLRQFFEFCGIGDVDWGAIHSVLDRDALEGTIYDREERSKQTKEMTAEVLQDIYDVTASRPLLGAPDVILPGTLCLFGGWR